MALVSHPRVGTSVLGMAAWGIVITAFAQWAKLVNNAFGTGILPSGGDTFLAMSSAATRWDLPVAAITGIVLRLGTWSVFGSRALEEVLKAAILFARYRSASWLRRLKT